VRASFRPARILWEQIALPVEASRWRLDVMFNPGFTAPVLAACPSVTVFHDLQHKRHPEYFRWFDLPFWRLLLWSSAHRSQRLIADSESTRVDLLRFYRIPSKPIDVIPLGVEHRFFELDRTHLESYVLCVSTLHPHKNLDRLIRAYARGKRDFRLVLAGMHGFHARSVERLIAEFGVADSVQLTGWIPREELYNLYERACAFIYPSTFEGFGMPVLEAMAAGIPTACSEIPVLREVAGDAALFFDPRDEDAIGAALDCITRDNTMRRRLAEAGPERAGRFTWEQTAAKTLRALME
jgi:glycosyltransferase involved in cell wall biosynthesis